MALPFAIPFIYWAGGALVTGAASYFGAELSKENHADSVQPVGTAPVVAVPAVASVPKIGTGYMVAGAISAAVLAAYLTKKGR